MGVLGGISVSQTHLVYRYKRILGGILTESISSIHLRGYKRFLNIDMEISQNFCIDEISHEFDIGSPWVINKVTK